LEPCDWNKSSVLKIYFMEGDGSSVPDFIGSENHWNFRVLHILGEIIQVTGKELEVDMNISAFLYDFCITEKLCSY
jgi:hypothetical protein